MRREPRERLESTGRFLPGVRDADACAAVEARERRPIVQAGGAEGLQRLERFDLIAGARQRFEGFGRRSDLVTPQLRVWRCEKGRQHRVAPVQGRFLGCRCR